MNNLNIFIGGVGGQGLVLMTKIISEAVHSLGFDVKTNDVVGLSQRGGKIWGTIKFGEKVYSPNILPSTADYLIGLEPLEAYRWIHLLKPEGTAIINTSRVYPTMVTMERMPYPENIDLEFSKKGNVISLDATNESRILGNPKMSNTVLIGILAKSLDKNFEIAENATPDFNNAELYALDSLKFHDAMLKSIEKNIPEKLLNLNLSAFKFGYDYYI
ncbi:MAG: indolepyruvate oxidoreductase subunit beta [Proteocatella sp.]